MAKNDSKKSADSSDKKASEKAREKETVADATEPENAPEPGPAKTEKPKKAAQTATNAEKPAIVHADAHGDHGNDHKPNRREYMVIFVVLAALTALEVGITKFHVPHTSMVVALIGLALTKAACVGLYYMHLKNETRILRLTVMLPFSAPAVYALVLISEAAWRLARW